MGLGLEPRRRPTTGNWEGLRQDQPTREIPDVVGDLSTHDALSLQQRLFKTGGAPGALYPHNCLVTVFPLVLLFSAAMISELRGAMSGNRERQGDP